MQPLYFLITTAGADTNSICYETHQKAKDILEGRKIDPTFYPVIYGADESDDWTDPKVWKKANPSLGITVGIDKVRAALRRAPNRIPARRIPSGSCGSTSGSNRPSAGCRWRNGTPAHSRSTKMTLKGAFCYGGLDLSSTTDITAFVLVFPPTG